MILVFWVWVAVLPPEETRAVAPATELSDYQIAYNVLFDSEKDDYEIFVMNLDGSNKRNISNWQGVDWVYHARAGKLYFVSDRDGKHRQYQLYEMNAEGGEVRRISQFLLVDSWVGSRLNEHNEIEFVVCSAKDGAGHELYLIDHNGNQLKRLTENTEYENDPCFSADGRQIVFRSKKSGKDELWIMNAEGGEWRQLTFYPVTDDSLTGKHGYHAGPPFWEPNANLISFGSKRDGNYSIFAIHPDGSGLRRITSPASDAIFHVWSPDGRWLLFDGTDADGVNYDIYLQPGDGGQARRLTDGPTYEQGPVFVRRAAKPR